MQEIQEAKKQLSKAGLPNAKCEHVLEMVRALATIPGVEAVALSGSQCYGRATRNSDIDLAICYFERSPPGKKRLLKAAEHFTPNIKRFAPIEKNHPLSGGASLNTKIGKIGWCYRSLDKSIEAIDAAKKGLFVWDKEYAPYGFSNAQYLAWFHYNIILYDPSQTFARLKKEVQQYPEPLQKATIEKCLWDILLIFKWLKKIVDRDDVYVAVSFIHCIVVEMTYVLFALNKEYYFADKYAIDKTESFSIKPKNYVRRIHNFLAQPGRGNDLKNSIRKLEDLVAELMELIPKSLMTNI